MIRLTLVCDACPATFGEGRTISELRRDAAALGWRTTREGNGFAMDFCPACLDRNRALREATRKETPC